MLSAGAYCLPVWATSYRLFSFLVSGRSVADLSLILPAYAQDLGYSGSQGTMLVAVMNGERGSLRHPCD
jgi:hypothetical protein